MDLHTPNAPHFGGLWEAGVKATKHHLLRVIGDHTVTFEELSNFLVEIEACLNSRPLWVLSDDPDDLQSFDSRQSGAWRFFDVDTRAGITEHT